MSSKHAHLARALGKWVLEDDGSKNGTRLNGEACDRAELHDEDVIELGRTFFYFRSGLEVPPQGAGHLDGAALTNAPTVLHSLVPMLADSLADLARVASSSVPILLGGETGTGKELAARAIHELSGRPGEFVAVNCGALPDSLVESELFGHRKGAFSGADSEQLGLVRCADGGTLFLDEIGDLSAASQVALLRVLQQKEVVPVGGNRPVPVDFRLVSASHRTLRRQVDEGHFREDLLARISGFSMTLRPLRNRRADLPLVLSELLARLGGDSTRRRLATAVVRFFYQHPWPRNVRELEHALNAAIALAGDGEVEWAHFAKALGNDGHAATHETPSAARSKAARSEEDEARRQQLIELLREHDGNVSAVSRHLGKARMQIQRWLKRYGIEPADYRR